MRRLRRALPQHERCKAALAVAHQLLRLPLFKPGARIGIYLALPGELSLQVLIEQAWARGCRCCATHHSCPPQTDGVLSFTPASRLYTGPWRIPQLRDLHRQQKIDTATLDAVLVPTVAFDPLGNRLGMGAGFYDRHFARLRRTPGWQRPHLIGVAYACQQVAVLGTQPHDVRLEMIATECTLLRAQRR
jgi:5-formyltetrahydrofolate cyclo-ligase